MNFRFKEIFLHFAIITFAISISSCSFNKKIPVTTTSKEALKYYRIGLDYADKLLAHEARNYFETAIVLDSSFALGYLGLAQSSPNAKGFFKNFAKAKALINNISEGEKLWILGVEAGNDGDQVKQNEYYKKLVKLYPGDERSHALLGQSYFFGLQQYEKSISSYKKAIDINPEFSPAYNIIGYAYRTLERYDEAEKAFKKYIKLIPKEANPYDSYAELLFKIGKYEKSIKFYKKALAVDPNFQLSYRGIAGNLTIMGKYEEARDKLQIMIEKALNTGNKRNGLYGTAITYLDEGNLKLTLATINKMKLLDENLDDSVSVAADLNMKGLVLLEFGKYDLALEQFKQRLQLINKSNLSRQIKQNSEVLYTYQRTSVAIKRLEIDSAYYYSDLHKKLAEKINTPFLIMRNNRIKGMIALMQKDYNNAILYFEKSNQQNPYNIYRTAMGYEGLENFKKAKELYNKAAHFNIVNDLNFWLIRKKALTKASEL